MDYRLVISRQAHLDVDNITAYIAVKLRNPQAAARFLDDVEKCYLSVVKNPHLYILCPEEPLRNKGYRRVLIKNYIVFYHIDEPENKIFIVRVIYGSRDYSKLL
jgi:plasmid stabilization system protein ParE